MTRSDFHLELVTVRLLKKKKKKRIIESQYKNLIFPQKCRKAEPLSIGTQHGMPQRNDMQTFIWWRSEEDEQKKIFLLGILEESFSFLYLKDMLHVGL